MNQHRSLIVRQIVWGVVLAWLMLAGCAICYALTELFAITVARLLQ